MIIPPRIHYGHHLTNFKGATVKALVDRFTTDKDKGEKVMNANNTPRNIVTLDLFSNKLYVIASILDPRVHTLPYDGNY